MTNPPKQRRKPGKVSAAKKAERARSSIVDRELRTFSPKQKKFIEGIDMGLDIIQAAKHAELAVPHVNGHLMLNRPHVREELNRRLTKNRATLEMTKERAQKMVLRAYEVAEMQADAGSMVRAMSEINRMCGFYATVERKVQLDVTVVQKQEQLRALSDEDLIRLAGEHVAQTLEGEVVRAVEHEVGAILVEDGFETADND